MGPPPEGSRGNQTIDSLVPLKPGEGEIRADVAPGGELILPRVPARSEKEGRKEKRRKRKNWSTSE